MNSLPRCAQWVGLSGNRVLLNLTTEQLSKNRTMCTLHFPDSAKVFYTSGVHFKGKGTVPSLLLPQHINVVAFPETSDKEIPYFIYVDIDQVQLRTGKNNTFEPIACSTQALSRKPCSPRSQYLPAKNLVSKSSTVLDELVEMDCDTGCVGGGGVVTPRVGHVVSTPATHDHEDDEKAQFKFQDEDDIDREVQNTFHEESMLEETLRNVTLGSPNTISVSTGRVTIYISLGSI